MPRRPRPPKAWHELQALYERWGQVDDWCDAEVGAAFAWRSFAFSRAQFITSWNVRSEVHVKICERHSQRLEEIDGLREAFDEAYHGARALIDSDALIAYAVKIKPFVDEEMKRIGKERLEKLLKSKGVGSKNDRKDRNKRLPQAYRKAEIADEGAGGGAGSADREREEDEGT